MSTGTLATVVKRTRAKMLSVETDSLAAEFTKRFAMHDGDYIEFERNTSHGLQMRTGRILCVEEVYCNQGGGYTAVVKVLPLLATGRVGNSRCVKMCVNKNGTGLKGVGDDSVRRVVRSDVRGDR